MALNYYLLIDASEIQIDGQTYQVDANRKIIGASDATIRRLATAGVLDLANPASIAEPTSDTSSTTGSEYILAKVDGEWKRMLLSTLVASTTPAATAAALAAVPTYAYTRPQTGAVAQALTEILGERPLSVRAFGAKGDLKSTTVPCTISSGTPTRIKVNNAGFTIADIGKAFFINGAGASGGAFASTITGIVSSDTVTVQTAASTFFSAQTRTATWGTDDSAAIQLAVTAARAALATTRATNAQILFPPGGYVVLSTIDITSLKGVNISGAGAVLYGATTGKAVIDGMGIYNTEIQGLSIQGDAARMPRVGLQIGRNQSGATAFGRNKLSDMDFQGYFSLAGFYNMCSETSVFENLNVVNNQPSYAHINDGCHHFGLTSDFLAITLTADIAVTNTATTYIGCKFQCSSAGGVASWTAAATAHYYRACYFTAPTPVMVYSTATIRTNSLVLEGTFEGTNPTCCVYLDGSGISALYGLEISDTQAQSTVATIQINPALTMKLHHARVRSGGLSGTVKVFDPIANFVEVSGDFFYNSIASGWASPTKFYGRTTIGGIETLYNNGTDISAVAAGAVNAITPSFLASANNTTEGVVYFKRADGTDRTSRMRYRGDAAGSSYLAFDVHNGTLTNSVGSVIEAMRLKDNGATILGGPVQLMSYATASLPATSGLRGYAVTVSDRNNAIAVSPPSGTTWRIFDLESVAGLTGAPTAGNLRDALSLTPQDTVDTIAALRALSTTLVKTNNIIYVKGSNAANDGGGGFYMWDGTSVATDNTGLVVKATATTTGRWLRIRSGNTLNVRWFGATGNGTTNDQSAIQATINAANAAGGGTVYFPAGTYRRAKGAGLGTITLYSSITLDGEGDASILFHDDDLVNTRSDFMTLSGTNDVTIKNLKILSNAAAAGGSQVNQSQCIVGTSISNLRFENVTIEGTRYMAIACTYARDVIVTNCRLNLCTRDGVRFIHSVNVKIIGNHFYRVMDDCIALHSLDAALTTVPQPYGLIIEGNTFEACQCVKVLGARSLSIMGNTMVRMLRFAIDVDVPGGSEGDQPLFNINISNNIIQDTFGSLGNNYVINVTSRGFAFDGSGALPGVTSGVFASNYNNDVDATGGVYSGAHGIRIKDNIISRTLPPVANYSAYDVGLFYDRVTTSGNGAGWGTDQAVTDADFSCHYINVTGAVRGLQIIGNILTGGAQGLQAIKINGSDGTLGYPEFDDVLIKDNVIRDFPGVGIGLISGNANSLGRNIVIRNNMFDLDPYFRNTAHNADNTWTTSQFCIGIQNSTTNVGLVVVGNTFMHLQTPMSNFSDVAYVKDNFVVADFIGSGYNASNKGVGTVPAGYDFVTIKYDGDPTSPTFGTRQQLPRSTSTSMPTAGWYLLGSFVRNASPTISSGKVLWGWLRLVTGSNHVLNTDWAAVYGTTS